MIHLDLGGGTLSAEDITLKVERVGQEHCDPKKKHEARKWANASSLHFVLYGSGILIANGQKIPLNRGDVFLLFAGREYEYYPVSHDPWSYIWVDFSSNATEKIFDLCGISPEKPHLHLTDLTAYIDLLKSMFEAYDASDIQGIRCSAYFLLILGEMIKRTATRRQERNFSSLKQRRVREILTYINNNYRLQLTVQDIATQNQISVSRMMALFAEVVGMPPIVYLNRIRVSAACELLQKSNSRIGEISYEVGIDDRLYFSRLFKKYKGMSPREYRAANPEEDPYDWLKKCKIDFR